jgi:hypothetical protein
MTMRVRASLMLMVAVMMVLTGCDHYVCSTGASFGSGCTSSGGGVSSGGGGTGGGTGNSGLALAYYVNNSQVGSIELDSTGLLYTPNFVLPTLPASYTSSGMVIAQKKYVYVPYASSAQMLAWSIDGTGALTPLTGSPFAAPYAAGIVLANEASFPIITNPAGTLLFVADTVNSQVDVLQIDSSTGLLTAVPGSPFTTVIPPWNLATDGLGKFLYITEGNISGSGEGGLNTAVYTINASTGALSGGSSMAFDMWEVQGEPLGKFMIGVTGRTGKTGNNDPVDPHVYVFSINQASGVLTQVTGSPFPTVSGNGPIGVVVHPNGQFVYDFNLSTSTGLDGAVEGFQLNSSTGALTSLGAPFSSLTAPYTGFFDQSGAYLFIHAAGSIGVFNVDSTTGIPTEPTQPLGVGSGAVVYPWAITDPI